MMLQAIRNKLSAFFRRQTMPILIVEAARAGEQGRGFAEGETEDTLRKSEERYRRLVESVTDYIYTVEVENGRAVSTRHGHACVAVTGVTSEEYDADPYLWIRMVYEQDRGAVIEQANRILSGEDVKPLEHRIIHKDGSIRWLRNTPVPRRDEYGRLVAYDGLIFDITGRKRMEEALRRSEDNLNRAQEVAHIGSWYLDVPENELLWSKETYRMFGVPFDTPLTYEAFLSIVHPDDRDYVDRCWKAALSREPYDIEHRIIVKGEVKWVHEKAELVFNEKGEPISGIGTVQDITNLKIAEEELKRSKEFNETILNSMRYAICIIDPEGKTITAANRAFIETYGQDVIGRHCYEVTHRSKEPCASPEHPCPMVESLRGSSGVVYEHLHYSMDGRRIYAEVSTAPIKDRTGKVVLIIHAESDITERKDLEEQLRQAQKMKAIGTLTGGIAHDFNNILTAIMGYGSLMRIKMKEDDPLRTYLEQILFSTERAASLIQSLLAFSRKQIINPVLVNLNDIVRRVEKLLTRLIGEDIDIKTILADVDLNIMADSVQIEQVLINLATNARDAMPEGGVFTIETKPVRIDEEYIRRHAFTTPGMYAMLSITDTGVGMDEKMKERIFEPFFTTKEIGKGTGLGLSIVHGIIKQHNGNINVYSEPGRGTTFKIYLPLIKSEIGIEQTEVLPPPMGGTETILLAEDDETVRELIKNILKESGYKMIEAVDGEDALERFAENRDSIQLILLDVIMPKKSGKEIYEIIKAIKPDIKALFMSGYTADIIHKKGMLDVGIDFIQKPLSPDELLRKVREVLDR